MVAISLALEGRSAAMAVANASARGQRAAILATRLTEFSGYYVAVDCESGGCGGERTFAVSDLEGSVSDQGRWLLTEPSS